MEIYADDGSLVFMPEITNVTAKSLNITLEATTNPGGRPSGPRPGPAPGATHVALNGSLISKGKLCDVNVDGDLNYSARVKPPTGVSALSGRGDPDPEAPPPVEGPAEKFIRQHKIDLIDCLTKDLYILQFVDQEEIVSSRQYDMLYEIRQAEPTVTRLIQMVRARGETCCRLFLKLLQEPEVVEAYPKLKDIMAEWCPGTAEDMET